MKANTLKAVHLSSPHIRRLLKLVRAPREVLNREGLLPHCSPFSVRWMSSRIREQRSLMEPRRT